MLKLPGEQTTFPGKSSRAGMIHRQRLDQSGLAVSRPFVDVVLNLPELSSEILRFADIELLVRLVAEDVQPGFVGQR